MKKKKHCSDSIRYISLIFAVNVLYVALKTCVGFLHKRMDLFTFVSVGHTKHGYHYFVKHIPIIHIQIVREKTTCCPAESQLP